MFVGQLINRHFGGVSSNNLSGYAKMTDAGCNINLTNLMPKTTEDPTIVQPFGFIVFRRIA